MTLKPDRRLTPATDRIAHVSLQGKIDAASFTSGTALRVVLPLVDLLRRPNGARERQLALGESFIVVDQTDDHSFGFATKDGYCGWLPDSALADGPAPTHWVASSGTHLYPEPRVQSREIAELPMGAQLHVTGQTGAWALTPQGFVPLPHLRTINDWLGDPVAVAEGFLGTPYLWGGNSRAGMDCSGLVQLCHLACGIACPGDADLQETMGTAIGDNTALQRGDLLFWSGHVAIVVDDHRLIHANGNTMSVAYEDTDACIARITAQNGGPVTQRRRL